MGTFRLSSHADRDLDEIWEFIAADSGEMADRFIRLLVGRFELLSDRSMIGRPRDDLRFNLRSFPYRSYNIFYFRTAYGVEIYRVLHAARDIETVFTGETE